MLTYIVRNTSAKSLAIPILKDYFSTYGDVFEIVQQAASSEVGQAEASLEMHPEMYYLLTFKKLFGDSKIGQWHVISESNVECTPRQKINYAETPNRIFMIYQNKKTTKDDLKRDLRVFGEVEYASLTPAKSKHIGGYGYVTFIDPASVTRVFENKDSILVNGKNAVVMPYISNYRHFKETKRQESDCEPRNPKRKKDTSRLPGSEALDHLKQLSQEHASWFDAELHSQTRMNPHTTVGSGLQSFRHSLPNAETEIRDGFHNVHVPLNKTPEAKVASKSKGKPSFDSCYLWSHAKKDQALAKQLKEQREPSDKMLNCLNENVVEREVLGSGSGSGSGWMRKEKRFGYENSKMGEDRSRGTLIGYKLKRGRWTEDKRTSEKISTSNTYYLVSSNEFFYSTVSLMYITTPGEDNPIGGAEQRREPDHFSKPSSLDYHRQRNLRDGIRGAEITPSTNHRFNVAWKPKPMAL